MTKHDKGVLSVCRDLLKRGAKKIEVGQKVVSHKKIVSILQKEYPTRKVIVNA